MRTLKQLRDYDCAYACMMMLVGMPYTTETAKNMWGVTALHLTDENKGLHGTNFFKALDRVGLPYKYTMMSPQFGSLSFLRFMLWGRRALLQVNSKNVQGVQHLVYWDGQKLRDPSNLICYTSLEECEPNYVFIFDEDIE